MGKLVGLLMIAAGVGTAAYVYPLIGSSDERADAKLSENVAIAAPEASAKRTPPTIVVTKAEHQGASRTTAGQATATPRAALAPTTGSLATSTPAAPPLAVAAAVATTVPSAKPLDPPVPQPAKRSRGDEERVALARSIQVELKRVGCFQGDLDGSWSDSTRQAMKTFIERVNASLPVDEPDHILKTLVQGHPGNACGKSPIIAQAPTPAKRPTERAAGPQQAAISGQSATATAPVPRVAETTGKSSGSADKPATSSWEAAVTATAPPVVGSAMAPTAGTSNDLRRGPELPGRMAVGASPELNQPVATASAVAEPPKTRFVVQPKAGSASPPPPTAVVTGAEPKVEETDDRAQAQAPMVGAVAAASQNARRTTSAPAPRVAAYRTNPPPPRYLGGYNPDPRPVARPRFGPQVFRQLEASGR